MRALSISTASLLLALSTTACSSLTARPAPEPRPEPMVTASPTAAPVATSSASPVGTVATPAPTTPPPSPAEGSSFAASSNGLGYDLYAKLAKEPGNVAFSPASIEAALAMTFAGARGTTSDQMKKVMHVGADKDAALVAAGKALGALTRPHSDYELEIADQLFGEKSYGFDPGFLSFSKNTFGAPLAQLDFVKQFERGRGEINAFVAKTTHDHIRDLLPVGSVDDSTRLVLVNAIYMHAKWASAFDKKSTSPEAFFTGQSPHDVPMMHQVSTLGFKTSGDVAVLDMPYKGDDLAMTVLLPKDKDGLAKLEAELHAGSIEAFTSGLSQREVDVSLPKFKVAPPKSLALKGMLSALGMPLAFDERLADFTGMRQPGQEPLHIDDAYHKAFVDVDEEGTTAAAATAVVMSRETATVEPPRPVEFRADHPFVYVVRDVHTNLVLFMGRVVDPTA